MSFWPLYLAVGAVAGFLAGLLGVGGGLIIVPALIFIFGALGFPEATLVQLALGTSLASIVFTSMASLRAHHRRGAVLWPVFARFTPGIVAGTLAGTALAAHLPGGFLKLFFAGFLFYAATQMLLNLPGRPERELPGRAGMFGAGGVIGGVSALVGIGGGTLSVPFFAWCNVRLHQAVGTSAAVGLPIALAGAAGYMLNGLASPALPPWSLGFVYLPALAGIVAASMLAAPLGARTAHALPVARLRRIFAVLLYVLGLRMLWSLI